ncbi:MAG: type I glutamate--ammonia ligase [candidate division WOR-3 bacterium]
MSLKEIKDLIRTQKIKFIDIKYSDIFGKLRHITFPAQRIDKVVKEGLGFDGSSLPGFKPVQASDMILLPDLATMFIDPTPKEPTLSFFAEIFDTVSGKRFDRDPRFILAQAEAKVKRELGCDNVLFQPEFEFYIFDRVEIITDKSLNFARFETEELQWEDKTGYLVFKGTGYHLAPPFDRSSDFRSQIVNLLRSVGIEVKYHHHEGGRFSQVEIETVYAPALKAADQILLVKYLVKNLALSLGKTATFMPKPIYDEPGSGLHLHHYLAKNNRSIFYDTNSKNKLSRLAQFYIGGILTHTPSLCALTNPSTNSFRRLTSGFETPTAVFFSYADRTATIRIPGYIKSQSELAIEYRIPDATANPYFALAGILLAGLDGVKNKIQPNDSAKTNKTISIPQTLNQALAELQKDHDYLTESNIFPWEMLTVYIQAKEREAISVAQRPHPFECKLYYGC